MALRILVALGAVCLIAGTTLIAVPVGLITAGALLIAVGFLFYLEVPPPKVES